LVPFLKQFIDHPSKTSKGNKIAIFCSAGLMLLGRPDSGVFILLLLFAFTVFHLLKGSTNKVYENTAVQILIVFSILHFIVFSFSVATVTSYIDFGNRPEGSTIGLWINNFLRSPELIFGTLGYSPLGWLDTFMWPEVFLVNFAIFVTFAVIQMNKLGNEAVSTILLTLIISILIPTFILGRNRLVVGEFLQPRYFILIPVFILYLLLLLDDSEFSISTRFRKMMFVVYVYIYFIAFFIQVKRYAVNSESGSFVFRDWSWSFFGTPPLVLLLVSCLGFAVFLKGILFTDQIQIQSELNLRKG
jgi:hypothetical protein